MHLFQLDMSLKILLQWKSGSCNHSHSLTATSTPSLLWNQHWSNTWEVVLILAKFSNFTLFWTTF